MKSILTILLLLTAAPAAVAKNTVDCHQGNDAECRVEWNMTDSPRAQYVLERFDTETHTWQAFETLQNGPAGMTIEPVPVDNLYRVSACADYLQREGCIASTVLWVPFIAETVDELPDQVPLTPNESLHVNVQKDLGTDLANFDYNVGRVAYIMGTINPEDATPMTPPPVRHTDYEVVNSRLRRDVGRSYEKDRSKITPEIFVRNEVYIQWKMWYQKIDKE